jgi:hypothetical protein
MKPLPNIKIKNTEENTMSNFDETNRFVLFINMNNTNPKAPTHKGKVNIDGVEYQIAGWIKRSANGVDYIAGTVLQGSDYAMPPSTPQPKMQIEEDDSNIPF